MAPMREEATWLAAVCILCLLLGGEGATNPYFANQTGFSTPANNSVFFSDPGVPFSFSLFVFDADPSGTAAGNITIDTVQTMLSWNGVAFDPTSALDPPASSVVPMLMWDFPATISISQVSRLTNRTRIDVRFTDSKNDTRLLSTSFPYRRFCFTARTTGSDPGAPWTMYCYRIYVRLQPRVVNECESQFISTEIPPRVYIPCPVKALQETTVIAAGQLFESWIYYEDLNRDGTLQCTYCDSVQIAVTSDPGLPNGATVGPLSGGFSQDKTVLEPSDHTNLVYIGYQGMSDSSQANVAYLYSKKLTWRPSVNQFLTFTICVKASGQSPWKQMQALPPVMNPPQCFKIKTEPPDVRIDSTRTTFGADSAPQSLTVRCTYSYTLGMYEQKDFGPVLDGLPAAAPAAGFKQGSYQPVASVDPAYPLPPGAVLSDPYTIMVCSDLTQNCDAPSYPETVQNLTWSPVRGMEANKLHVCLRIGGAGIQAGSYLTCADWIVAKCQVCTIEGDTLLAIAELYQTTWLQIWGANLDLIDPNSVASESPAATGSVVLLGPTFVNTIDQSPLIIAEKFGMRPMDFFRLNPDLSASADVSRGASVCIVSEICSS